MKCFFYLTIRISVFAHINSMKREISTSACKRYLGKCSFFVMQARVDKNIALATTLADYSTEVVYDNF